MNTVGDTKRCQEDEQKIRPLGNSKILKDQNEHLTKQGNELKSTVSKLESQNDEQEMKTAPDVKIYGFWVR